MQTEVLEVAIAKAAAIEHLDFENGAFDRPSAVAAIGPTWCRVLAAGVQRDRPGPRRQEGRGHRMVYRVGHGGQNRQGKFAIAAL